MHMIKSCTGKLCPTDNLCKATGCMATSGYLFVSQKLCSVINSYFLWAPGTNEAIHLVPKWECFLVFLLKELLVSFAILKPISNSMTCVCLCVTLNHMLTTHLVKLPCFKSNLVTMTVSYDSLPHWAVELYVWSNQRASSLTQTLIEATHHCHLHSPLLYRPRHLAAHPVQQVSY